MNDEGNAFILRGPFTARGGLVYDHNGEAVATVFGTNEEAEVLSVGLVQALNERLALRQRVATLERRWLKLRLSRRQRRRRDDASR